MKVGPPKISPFPTLNTGLAILMLSLLVHTEEQVKHYSRWNNEIIQEILVTDGIAVS